MVAAAVQVVSSVFGALKGLVVLNLGVVSTFQELRQNFHKGPMQWWGRCVSEQGAHNISECVLRLFPHCQHHMISSTVLQGLIISCTDVLASVQWNDGCSPESTSPFQQLTYATGGISTLKICCNVGSTCLCSCMYLPSWCSIACGSMRSTAQCAEHC